MKCRACLLEHSPLLRCEVAARRAAVAARPVAAVLRKPAQPPKPDRRRR